MEPIALVLIVVAYFAGAFMHFLFSVYLIPYRHLTYVWLFSFRNHKKLGEPCKTDLVLNRKGFSLGYSFDRRCALWVSYIINRDSIGIDVERQAAFSPDPDVPAKFRTKPEHFTNSGYDKGHLAPSATIDFSRKSNDQTFLMSNIALQEPKLNRFAWNSLEEHVRKWTHTKGSLYIVTGPVYSTRPRKINEIPIPKAFYKVIYSMSDKKAIGFIMPNEAGVNKGIWTYAMSVKEAENKTGLKFFPALGTKGNKIKAKAEVNWWKKA